MLVFEESEAFLKYAHERSPGDTPLWFGQPLDPQHDADRCSYDLLIEAIPATAAGARVLDLACGDGFLGERLLARRPGVSLVGIDISDTELEAARKRLAGRDVELKCETARRMSLPDSSIDYVLCHMAFMLMDDVESVLVEVARVLKPEGVFAAVIGRGWHQGPIQDTFLGALRAALHVHRSARFAGLGDARVRSLDSLRALFTKTRPFRSPIAIDDTELQLKLTPPRLVQFMMGAYETACLSETGRQELEQELLRAFQPFAGTDGLIPYPLALRRITAPLGPRK